MIFWQTVLVDERVDRRGLRWPPAWVAGRDYLHRAGPVRLRGSRGREYITSDAVYADLANLLSVAPKNRESPLTGRPSQVVKRLHPLDTNNRTFALTVGFRIKADPRYLFVSTTDELPTVVAAFGRWTSELNVGLAPTGQTYPMSDLGAAVGAHIADATQGRAARRPGERVVPVGNAVFLATKMRWFGDSQHTPELVLDKPPGIRGQPFLALASSEGPPVTRRRLRTYALRTLAEVDIAHYLARRLATEGADHAPWIDSRAQAVTDFLSRPAPYGYSGEQLRRIWQTSISRHGFKAGAMRRLAVERLSSLMVSSKPDSSAANVFVMSDNYTFNAPVGAAGRGARGTVNINALARELQELSVRLRERDADDADATVIAEAAQDVEQGNGDSAEGKLRRLSRRTLTTARDLTLGVASAAIAHALGVD
jgi:hypothetical protein